METGRNRWARMKISLIVIIGLVLSTVIFNTNYIGYANAGKFGANIIVDDSPVNTYEPDIAVDSSGKLHTIWQDTRNVDYDIYYSNSINEGATWSSSVRVDNAPPGQPSYEPAVAVDTSGGLYDGNIYVVWYDARNGDLDVFVSISIDGGITWSADVRVDNAPATASSVRPSIAVDDGGAVYVVWDATIAGSNEIFISRSDDGGNTWNTDVQVSTSAATSSAPSIATYGAGIVYTAWHEYDGSAFSIMCARSADSGDTWSAFQVATGATYRGNADIAVDSSEKIYLTWIDEIAIGNVHIFFSMSSTQGSSWTPKVQVDDSTISLSSLSARIEVNPSGILVIWADSRNGDWDVFFSESADDGVTWGDGVMNNNDIRVNDNPIGDGTVQTQPSITASTWGIYVVWTDRRSTTITDIYFAGYVMSFLWITEFQDSPEGSELIEIFGYGGKDINLAGSYLSPDGGITQWDLTPLGTISPGEYRSIGDSSGNLIIPALDLNDESGTISLYNSTGDLLDIVRYGQLGTAPDPVSGESTARYWDGITYQNSWSMTLPGHSTPTFGAQNNVPDIERDPALVLNEICFNPSPTCNGYIELRFNDSNPLDFSLANHYIVVDSIYAITSGIMDLVKNLYFLNEIDYPLNFDMDAAGDNVYLYDGNGKLLDMAGWSSAHAPDKTMARVPEGNGTYDGYDDTSSINAGWVFDSTPTYGIIAIEMDQNSGGYPGEDVTYILNVTNFKIDTDVINLKSTQELGWPLVFYDGNWNPLPDTEPDGYPDVTLGPGATQTLYVNISIPFSATDEIENVTINATSTTTSGFCPPGFDTVKLRADVYPHLNVTKTVAPAQIYLNGSGLIPEEATVTVNLTGRGVPQISGSPQDVIFMLDSSGSMGGNDPDPDSIPCNIPFPQRVQASWNYIDNLTANDRGGYVDFDSTATLRVPLSMGTGADNYVYLKQDIPNGLWCSNQNGGTAFTPPLTVANNELINNGDPTHIWVEILLTDGQAGDYVSAGIQADIAAANNIIIYTIGLSMTPGSPAENFLNATAIKTGGKYFTAPDASALADIFNEIGMTVKDLAAVDPNPGDPLSPVIVDITPDYIDVNQSSITPGHARPSLRGLEVLSWRLGRGEGPDGEHGHGESRIFSYKIRSNKVGTGLNVTDWPNATVTYSSWINQSVTLSVPSAFIDVIAPEPPDVIPGNLPIPTEINVDGFPATGAMGSPATSDQINVGIGTIHSISAIATNIGVGGTMVNFNVTLCNCTSAGTPLDVPFLETTISPLAPSSSSPAVGTDWLAPNIPWNDYYVCIKVDSNDDVSESDETNNLYVIHFYTTTGYPDLIPVNIEINSVPYSFPVNVTVGQRVQIKSQVENIGTESNTANFYYSISEDSSPTPILNVSVGIILPGDLSSIYIVNWTAPPLPGICTIIFFADSDESIVESNELNNILTIELRVFALLEPPDLIVGVDGDDILLEWSAVAGASGYTVYGGESPEDIDFTAAISGKIAGTNWKHTNGNKDHKEYYYLIRSVDIRGWEGPASYIVGKFTKSFPRGYSAFSLPLEPIEANRVSWYTTDMPLSETDAIYRYDYSYQRWIGHPKLLPEGVDDFHLVMGEAYMIFAKEPFDYAFTGRPGTTIRFSSGPSQDPRIGTEGAFRESLYLEKVKDGIQLTWSAPRDVDLGTIFQPYETVASYNIYRAANRAGFDFANPYASTTDTSYVDENADGNEYYYMVVPVNAFGREGSSTYSAGIIVKSYSKGYSSFGLEFRMEESEQASWFMAEGEVVDALYYYDVLKQLWIGHPKLLPESIDNPMIGISEGYMVFVKNELKVAITGK